MYSPRTPYSKTPLSITKSHRAFGSNRRSSSYLTPTSRRAFTPTSIPSRNHSFNRSYQASIIEETSQHILEAYGTPLPVLVTEAITVAERVTDISVKLEESGWASLVCGRRLFIWKFKQDVGVRSVAHCRELTLPPSDLAHKAELVHVFMSKESSMPSVLAVSPEGIVRYWPNIVHEGTSVETTTDLQGQECYSLTSVHPLGCILATTTSSLVLITPATVDGQHSIICHTLKVPQGVLAGIGRRVSSFIFGGLPTQSSEAKQLNKVLSAEGPELGENFLYVLSSCTFQKWHLMEDEPDKLLFETDLDRCLKERFLNSIWNSDSSHLHQLKTWCLDMQLSQNGVTILVAGMNPISSQQMFYALVNLETSTVTPTSNISSFCIVKHSEDYQYEVEEKLLSYRFVFPSFSSQIAYLYSANKVICVQAMSSVMEPDVVDFSNTGNTILGAGCCDGLPLFFTLFHGLLALLPNQTSFIDTSLNLTPQKEVILKELEKSEIVDDAPSKLRSAMCLYLNNDVETCQKMINDMFSPSSVSKENSELDTVVIALSNSMIDDYPVSDPRWCESVPTGDSVSSSLIILHQLDDKLKAHDYFLKFLKAFGLFDRLSTIQVRDTTISTRMLLCEHAEKLIAAKAIRRFLVEHNEVLNVVIKETLNNRNIELKAHLTHQDMFFREVSSVDSLFPALADWEERQLADDLNPEDVINVITTVNNIFVGVFQAVLQYRQNKDNLYNLQENIPKAYFVPWTSSEGSDGIRTLLTKQHAINVENTLKVSDDLHIQGIIYQQVVDIIDFLLDGYVAQLESFKNSDRYHALDAKYSKERNQLIQPLSKAGQFERAAALAEKYCDFDILVQICEETSNQERLQRYTLQYKEQGFSEFVFKWYLDKGKRGKLLVQPVGQQGDLSRFLQGHENLSWLHHIHSNQYGLAQQTLKELAIKETQYLSKKKTLLSLSKLASLSSDAPVDTKNNQIEAINLELDLIAHQETLPEPVAEAFGLDPNTMRVLSPEELIEMYVTEDNVSANSYDFKIALDLLHFVKKPPGDSEYESLRQHVWCKAILRDNWDELDTNTPFEAIKDTLFFQIIELAFDQGVDLHDFLMPVHDLLQSPELSCLVDSPNFSFLLRAGYEHIMKLIE